MIWLSDEWKDYAVLDASDGERLERWGKYLLVRPDPQVIRSILVGSAMTPAISAPIPAAVIGRTISCRSAGRFGIRTI